MAEEEVKPVEEVVETVEAKQEELPLAAATEEKPEAEPVAKDAGDKPEEPKKSYEQTVDESTQDWRFRELKVKHAQVLRAREREQELQAKVDAQAALLAKFNQGKPEEPAVVPADEIERRVQAEIAQRTYAEKSNAVNANGQKKYGAAWEEAINNLTVLNGFDMATMNGIMATDDPEKVLFEMGKNPDNYHRIMALPLERRIIEMGKMAMQPVTKQVSNAPAPVSPVGGRAAPAKETLSDNMDDDKWFSIRRQQKLAKFQASHLPRR